MKSPSLKIAAAEYVLGLIPRDSLPVVADSLVDAGVITPSIAELASRQGDGSWDVAELFEDSVRELGGELPSRREAIEIVLRDRLQGVVTATDFPQPEVDHVMVVFRLIRDELFEDDLLWSLYADFDAVVVAGDPPRYRGEVGQRALELIEADLREDAQAWLDAHATA